MSLLLLLREKQSSFAPQYTGAKDVSVRLQALDGAWEVCGSDHARGIIPENVELRSDQWGSSRATFDLRRNPKEFWPDIGAFTPVEIEVGGTTVWSGRVSETPVRDSTDSVISVQCEGWQAHLDDDIYERTYVQTQLSDWKDVRTTLSTDLTRWTAGADVNIGSFIFIGYSDGSTVRYNNAVGCTLDLGTNSTAKRVIIDYSFQGTTSFDDNFYVRGHGSPNGGFPASDQEGVNVPASAASSPLRVTFTTARRYVTMFFYRGSTDYTAGAGGVGVKITSVQVFAETAYESSDASVLKSDQVVKDALAKASVLLSSDRSQIAAGTFNIPEFSLSEPRTPRAVWEAVDAFEDRYKKITVDKVPVYKTKPTYPEVEVGAWSGMEFEDSAANSGDDVYSRVIVTGQQPNGIDLRVPRTQSQQPGVLTRPVLSPGFSNPTFATNTTGWTVTNSTITRDTVTFDTSPASGRWDNTGASDALLDTATLSASVTDTFLAGNTYTLSFRMRVSAAANITIAFTAGTTVIGAGTLPITQVATWITVPFTWTPKETVTGGVTLKFSAPRSTLAGGVYAWFDSVSIFTAVPTVVERRGFQRTKQLSTSFMLTAVAATQIADKWLLSHKTTPFKGKAKISGNDAIRDITSGRPVAPEQMLLRTGELIRFSDRIDPDTGAQGRDGKIVEAAYKVEDNSVELTIDSSRAGFEALLNRLGVVLGQMR